MNTVIQQILESTKNRIKALDKPLPSSPARPEEVRNFRSAVAAAKKAGRVPVIAEIKPASPKKHFKNISSREAAGLAREMEAAGAVALSVLTEPEVFCGSLENLDAARKAVSIPVLRKDFILDPGQLEETQTDLVLLIAGVLGEKLEAFVSLALSIGLEPLVEVHSEAELEQALYTQAMVIGINNRDLETLKIDLATTEKLAPLVRDFDRKTGTSHLIISESGVQCREDALRVVLAGADAVLVGSAIMESGSVFEKTKELVKSSGWR